MRILVLGGTVFVGRAVAVHARDAGHQVTCAARGASGEVPSDVAFVKIDRDDPATLSNLDGHFDAVIDVSRRPSHVRTAVAALADRVGHWVFVSSCSAYADQTTPFQRVETAPLLPPAPVDVDEHDSKTYGARKVACEQALPPDAFLCRAGLIVGPEDTTNRFDYWVSRLDRSGEIAAPGSPDDLVQCIDVRDLAAWLVHAMETGLSGPLDGIGAPITRADFFNQLAQGIGARLQLTWIDQDFLAAQAIEPWSGERSLPMWLPLPEYGGFMTRDVTPAMQAGLKPRPLAETARDTLAYLATSTDAKATAGLTPQDEAALLAAWHSRPTR